MQTNAFLDHKELMLLIIRYLKENRTTAFRELLDELQPYDIAELYNNLPEKHHHKFLLASTPDHIAALLQETLDPEMQREILLKLGIERSSKAMDLMENDDLADMLNHLSVDVIDQYLQAMKQHERTTVQHLMQYPEDTAGGIMTNRYVWIRHDYTVNEAVDKLRAFASFAENIYYLYVLDDDKKLTGVVSYRDLLLSESDEKISNIMYRRVISVPIDMDQEEVAKIIERYDFISVPVVDHEQKLVGIITVDDIIDVMIDEANEDFEKFTSSGKSIDFDTSAWTASIRRLPWLILLLFLGLLSGSVISGFESTLERVVVLTFFMPMIAGMTGNTGTQSLAIVVRGLVSEDLGAKRLLKLIFREFSVGFIIGTICGVLVAAVTYVWQGNPMLSLVIGLSLFLTLVLGTLSGTVIPIILSKLKIDPAIASGPLITTINDIFSLSVYFGLATMFIHYLV